MILFVPHPQMRAILLARLAGPVSENAQHLVPIWRGVAEHGFSFATVMQDEGRWTLPEGRPIVLIVGDDLEKAKGPRAFSGRSLRAFLPRCAAIAFVGSAGLPEVYSNAARMARDGHTVAIIESQPEHEEAWLDLVNKAAPEAKLLVCRPWPRSMAN